jgi:hypothetical protein
MSRYQVNHIIYIRSVYIDTHTHKYIQTYYIYIYIHIYIYIYCSHVHIHIHTHTHKHRPCLCVCVCGVGGGGGGTSRMPRGSLAAGERPLGVSKPWNSRFFNTMFRRGLMLTPGVCVCVWVGGWVGVCVRAFRVSE